MGFTTAQLVNLAVTQLMPTNTAQTLQETPMDATAFNARAKTFSSPRTIL
jgi:hypothetical protein